MNKPTQPVYDTHKIFEEHRVFHTRLATYADWAIRAIIVITCTFIWQMYTTQQGFIQKINEHDMRVTQLEKDIARIEGNMVTIETLKRVEIYMELVLAKAKINQKVDLSSDIVKKK